MQDRAFQGEAEREILVDKGSRGRYLDWRGHKMRNELLALAYDQIDRAKAQRLRDCASVLVYRMDDGKKRLTTANFCRVRLCPICQWRRSLKNFAQMLQILRYCQKEQELSYIFVTLTIRNCTLDDLGETLDHLFQSWKRLMQTTAIKGGKNEAPVIKGWYRGVEITHNLDVESPNYNTFHPHIHAIFAVRPTYFKGREYISRDKLRALWARSARLDYEPQVDMRKVRSKGSKEDDSLALADAVAEASKYSVKDSDVVVADDWDLTIDTVRGLDQILANRRFVGLGGCFLTAHRALHLDDVDDGDLVHIVADESGIEETAPRLVYVWQTGYKQYIRE